MGGLVTSVVDQIFSVIQFFEFPPAIFCVLSYAISMSYSCFELIDKIFVWILFF